jgi:transcriptional regulator with XRE-family HTH domain
MIKNDKQLTVTKKRLNEFVQALESLKSDQEKDPILKDIEINSVLSYIAEFKKDIQDYEDIKNGNVRVLHLKSLSELGQACVKSRIAKGWSQALLAEKLGVAEQQIQRYESENYASVNYNRLNDIIEALEINFTDLQIEMLRPKFDFFVPANDQAERIRVLQERKYMIAV